MSHAFSPSFSLSTVVLIGFFYFFWRIIQYESEGRVRGEEQQPSALSRTLSRALNITVATVIAGRLDR